MSRRQHVHVAWPARPCGLGQRLVPSTLRWAETWFSAARAGVRRLAQHAHIGVHESACGSANTGPVKSVPGHPRPSEIPAPGDDLDVPEAGRAIMWCAGRRRRHPVSVPHGRRRAVPTWCSRPSRVWWPVLRAIRSEDVEGRWPRSASTLRLVGGGGKKPTAAPTAAGRPSVLDAYIHPLPGNDWQELVLGPDPLASANALPTVAPAAIESHHQAGRAGGPNRLIGRPWSSLPWTSPIHLCYACEWQPMFGFTQERARRRTLRSRNRTRRYGICGTPPLPSVHERTGRNHMFSSPSGRRVRHPDHPLRFSRGAGRRRPIPPSDDAPRSWCRARAARVRNLFLASNLRTNA